MVKVLIVDDDSDARNLFKFVLESCGCQIVLAENGQQALDTLSTQSFDLMLLDLQMPVLSGEGVLQPLRVKGSLYMDMRIILTTAYVADENAAIRELAKFVERIIFKPFDVVKLQKIVLDRDYA